MTRINITIDSREQTPWAFPPNLVTAEINKLDAGDYALTGDDGFAIERKNLDDFAGTISSGWQRFLRELDRMSGFDVKAVVVEGRMRDCCFWEDAEGNLHHPKHNHPRVIPPFILKQIAILTMRGVTILFADNADIAAGIGYALLKERSKVLCQQSTTN